MHRLRIPLSVLLIVVVAVDSGVLYRLWNFGWPKRVNLTSPGPGVEQIHVLPVPFTGGDWLILALVIGAHAVLLYLTWRAWRSGPVHL